VKAFDYAIAETRGAALEAAAEGWRVKAGGIDLLDHLKERIEGSTRIVGIHPIEELRGVREEAGALVIGPLTTLRELDRDATVRRILPALADAAGETATPQIRARATVGGNLCQRPRCWYYRSRDHECLKKGGGTCFAVEGENQFHALFGGGPCHIVHPSNLAPVLVAAGAELMIESAGGSRVVKGDKFFVSPSVSLGAENVLRPEEVVVAVRIAAPPSKSAYVELRQKQSFDWPLASCAAVFAGDRWNVVLGAVAPIPWRAEAAEALLADHDSITAEVAERAADAALEGAEPMSRNGWRLRLVRAAVRRALLRAEGLEVT
jgi:xanthine dehydrogenase YagS FAD-binding subunit